MLGFIYGVIKILVVEMNLFGESCLYFLSLVSSLVLLVLEHCLESQV